MKQTVTLVAAHLCSTSTHDVLQVSLTTPRLTRIEGDAMPCEAVEVRHYQRSGVEEC